MQFEIPEDEDRDVLPVADELLAEPAVLHRRAAAVVDGAGFLLMPIPGLRGRVVVLKRAGASRQELDRLSAQLRQMGIATSLAYVTPNKVVVKADVTPDLVTEDPPERRDDTSEVPHASRVRVALLDTGIALCERTDGWLDGLENDETRDPLDVFPQPNKRLDVAAGHGTFVAGLFQQIDPRLELLIHRALDTDGFVSEVDVARALVQAVDDGLDYDGRLVVNLSLGTETIDDRPPLALQAALAIVREIEAERRGEVLLVAAAGNDGSDRRCWPAAFAADDPRVVAVAGLTTDGTPAGWSTYGPWVTCSAVGEAVMSTFVSGTEDPAIDTRNPQTFGHNAWAYWTGTSFAAPQVAAVVARDAQRGDISLGQALHDLLATGTDDSNYGRMLRNLI